ncbi:MAG TPA: hypothetical protein VGJ28_09915 [Micromonosporaceae bacterium]|jgi:hypothetical protein
MFFISAVVVVLAVAAAFVSMGARRHRPQMDAVHAVRDDLARDPVSGPLRAGCGGMHIGVALDAAGRLQVGDSSRHNAGNTIGPLVLRALALRAQRYGGRVRPDQRRPITLMVEILESDSGRQAAAYKELEAGLRRYPWLWTRIADGVVTLGPVTVLLVGAGTPRHLVSNQLDRFAFCDGSFGDIGAWGAPVALVPSVSEHWSWRFGWDGTDEMPVEERVLLRQAVTSAHADGRQVRIYGFPERSVRVRDAFWRELRAAGVDVISTSRPRSLHRFLSRPTATASTRIAFPRLLRHEKAAAKQ